MNIVLPKRFTWAKVLIPLPGTKNTGLLYITQQPKRATRPYIRKAFLLIDSGAQYLDGTTDITRTIALGELTEEEKTDYTLILKGHIAFAMAKFPAGTRGAQLDVLGTNADMAT